MKKFQLKLIQSPGTVHLPGLGVVNLESIPESLQEKLYNSGCKYLEPTEEYRKILFPDEPSIDSAPLNLKGKKKQNKH